VFGIRSINEMTITCPKCKSEEIGRSFYSGVGGACRRCRACRFTFNTEGDKRNILLWKAKKETRPEKIDEIKAVWKSPKFKTNNRRLVHLFRHCKKVEYGYTIREFVYAIFPEKMDIDPKQDGGWGEYYALKDIRQMLRRFRHDMENHEVLLISRRLRSRNGVPKWYYYNTIEDEEGFLDSQMRLARITLGLHKIGEKVGDIMEMSEEERLRKIEETSQMIKEKYAKSPSE